MYFKLCLLSYLMCADKANIRIAWMGIMNLFYNTFCSNILYRRYYIDFLSVDHLCVVSIMPVRI